MYWKHQKKTQKHQIYCIMDKEKKSSANTKLFFEPTKK